MSLKTEIAAQALMHRARLGGAFAAVVAKGDPDAGVLLVKVNYLDGRAQVHAPSLGPDGEPVWMQPLGETPGLEGDIDAYLARRRDRDPDAWIIEIEDRRGRAFLV